MSVKIIQPGALTTVQDLGRSGYQESGMQPCGVMDQRSYKIANTLVGNHSGEAVLELSLFGGSYQFDSPCILALTGADMSPSLNRKPCPMNRAVHIAAGDMLTFGFAKSGCRTYLAVSGGIDVPPVMGSRSTNLKCRIGGFYGRALQAGDVLPVGRDDSGFEELKNLWYSQPEYSDHVTLRVVEGPQADYFTSSGLDTFYSEAYTVTQESDRMGCRLDGPAITSCHGSDIISDGIVFGSIQITSAGRPIILMADRQTTGGYAKIGTVCTADLPVIAQCQPGTVIHFKKISVEEAQKLLQTAHSI